MNTEKHRYFIELQPSEGTPVPRYQETEARRAMALQFIGRIAEWLKDQELIDKVSAMAITALGQVQITCEADIISHIRSQDALNIAVIRQGSMLCETVGVGLGRWNEAN